MKDKQQPVPLGKIDLRQLEQFLSVVDQGGFRGAARHLNTAQPSVSRNVSNLENALGVQLLVRSRQGVTPTPAGRALAEGARGLREEIRELAKRTQLADRGEIGELRIGYTDFAIAGVLPEIVKRFRARHPKVRLHFAPLVTGDQIEALRLGNIDAAMLTGPMRLNGFESRLAQSDPLMCFVPETHRFSTRKSVHVADLANENFVLGEQRGWAHFLAHITALCLRHGFLPNVVQEANDSTAILGLVSAGIGITLNIERNAMRKTGGFVCLALSGTDYEIETLLVRNVCDKNPLVDNLFSILDEFTPDKSCRS